MALFADPYDPFFAFRHAFRRSRIRVEIILILLEHGRLGLPDLARLVSAYPYNVHLALWGDNEEAPARKRYRIDECLIVLGLVDSVELGNGEIVYELTPLGAALGRRLVQEVDRRRGPRPRVRT